MLHICDPPKIHHILFPGKLHLSCVAFIQRHMASMIELSAKQVEIPRLSESRRKEYKAVPGAELDREEVGALNMRCMAALS